MSVSKKNETIAGSLHSMSGFVNRMTVGLSVLMFIFLVIIGVNFLNFYNVQYVTEKYQMEIRKDVQTINKRLLFALASQDPSALRRDLPRSLLILRPAPITSMMKLSVHSLRVHGTMLRMHPSPCLILWTRVIRKLHWHIIMMS